MASDNRARRRRPISAVPPGKWAPHQWPFGRDATVTRHSARHTDDTKSTHLNIATQPDRCGDNRRRRRHDAWSGAVIVPVRLRAPLPADGSHAPLERADDVSRNPPAVEPTGLWRHHLVVDEASVHGARRRTRRTRRSVRSARRGWGTSRRRWQAHDPRPAPRSIRRVPSTRRPILPRRKSSTPGRISPGGM